MKHFKVIPLGILTFVSLFFQSSLCAGGVAVAPEEQHQDQEMIYFLDDQMASLNRLKSYYTAKSNRYRTRANTIRLQKGDNSQEEYERLNKQADEYDKMVKNLNGDISRLDKQKRALEKTTNPQ